MYGIKEFAAVINPPQACILAVGAGEQRPVVKGGELAIATVMTLHAVRRPPRRRRRAGRRVAAGVQGADRGPADADALTVPTSGSTVYSDDVSELTQVSVREANQRFSTLVSEREGQDLVMTKHGRPVAHSAVDPPPQDWTSGPPCGGRSRRPSRGIWRARRAGLHEPGSVGSTPTPWCYTVDSRARWPAARRARAVGRHAVAAPMRQSRCRPSADSTLVARRGSEVRATRPLQQARE